jgi:hypothetical protein
MTDWLDDWAYRIPITIDHNKIDSDLTHFPVPITLSGTDAEAVAIELSGGAVTAKSVIFDIADNWGNTFLGIRQIDFWSLDSKITMTTNYTAYVTSYYNADFRDVFDTSLGKIGGWSTGGGSWLSPNWNNTNQRLVIVFDTAQTFDQIRVNNFHDSGAATGHGAKNVKINISSDEITNTTYGATITNSELIFDGQFDEHVASNVEDEQILGLSEAFNKKIAVALSDGTQLYCEIEQWDTVNNKITLWTSRSNWTISSTEDTILYLYYDGTQDDNTTYVGEAGDTAAKSVWDNDFKGVYLLNGEYSGITGEVKDSSSNENHLTGGLLSGNYPSRIDWGTGYAQDFTPNQDLSGDIYNFVGENELTIEAVVRYDNTSTYSTVISSNSDDGGSAAGILIDHARCFFYGVADLLFSPTQGDLSHIVGRVSPTIAEIILNNSVKDSITHNSVIGDRVRLQWQIGYRGTSYSRGMEGPIKFVRITQGVRSDEWIKADYHAQTNDLITFSAVEEMPTYIFSGTVRVLGTTSSGIELVLFHHPSNDLIGTDFSDSDGSFSISSTYDGTHYLVAFPPAGTNYNAEIIYDIQST